MKKSNYITEYISKKDFTLIEFIGVAIIISALVIIGALTIVSQLNNKKNKVSQAQTDILLSAAEEYIDRHPDVFVQQLDITYCITVSMLSSDGLLSIPPKNIATGETLPDDMTVEVDYDANGIKNSFLAPSKNSCMQLTR